MIGRHVWHPLRAAWLTGASLALLAMIAVTGCSRGPKADVVVVVKAVAEDGTASFWGRMSFELNQQTGQLEPSYRKPGTLYLFRVTTDKVGDVSAKPGDIFQVQAGGTLTKVGVFDLASTDEALVKRYSKS
jgi:hypothetical protein